MWRILFAIILLLSTGMTLIPNEAISQNASVVTSLNGSTRIHARISKRLSRIRNGILIISPDEKYSIKKSSVRVRTKVQHNKTKERIAVYLYEVRDSGKNLIGTVSIASRTKLNRKIPRSFYSGRIAVKDVGYEFNPRGGLTMIAKEQLSSLSGCGGPLQVPAVHRVESIAEPGPPQTSSEPIDIAIFYSPQVVPTIGVSQLNTHAIGLVQALNGAWQRSGVTAEARLVYSGTVNQSESGDLSQDLQNLQSVSDGVFDEVHSIRNNTYADLVALIVSQSDGSSCGIGYMLAPNRYMGDRAYGFTVSANNCLAGATFEHEIGHNMGSNHDIANSSGTPAYPDSYGWRFYGNDTVQYRTIMSYTPGSRIFYFSNPNISYQGVPMGVEGSANNARSHSATAPLISQFYGPPTPTPTATATPIPPPPTITPTPTKTPNLNTLPRKVSGVSVKVNKKGQCVASVKKISNYKNQPLNKLMVWAVQGTNFSKYLARKATDKKGAVTLTTKAKVKTKISLYFPTHGLYIGPYTCKK